MKIKSVDKCMTPLEKVFMLSLNDRLDDEVMDRVPALIGEFHFVLTPTNNLSSAKILKSGYSRVPIYQGSRNNIIGMLIIKSLLKLSPKVRHPPDTSSSSIHPHFQLFNRRTPCPSKSSTFIGCLRWARTCPSILCSTYSSEDRVRISHA